MPRPRASRRPPVTAAQVRVGDPGRAQTACAGAPLPYKHRIRAGLPKIYSQDLLNNLFRHPYTKIEALQNDLQVSRLTATKYLDRLTDEGFVEKHRIGRYNYYINFPLMRIFTEIPDQPETFDAPAMDSD